MVTGEYDFDSYNKGHVQVKGAKVTRTTCGHIFPQSIGYNLSDEKKVRDVFHGLYISHSLNSLSILLHCGRSWPVLVVMFLMN